MSHIRPWDIMRKLEALGETWQEVLHTLREKGIHGTVHAESCPVANYLALELRADEALVNQNSALVDGVEVFHNLAPIDAFICKFDVGKTGSDLRIGDHI